MLLSSTMTHYIGRFILHHNMSRQTRSNQLNLPLQTELKYSEMPDLAAQRAKDYYVQNPFLTRDTEAARVKYLKHIQKNRTRQSESHNKRPQRD